MANPKPAILVAVALGVAAGIVASVKPWAAYLDQREERKEVELELKDVQAERRRLEREEAKTRSEVGRETRARENGYVGPGERSVNLPPTSENVADAGPRAEVSRGPVSNVP